MVFSSTIFLLYFLPAFLLIYYLADVKFKNYIALAFSVFFYAWGAPDFIFIVLGSIIVDFYVVRKMYSAKDSNKKLWLAASVILNLGLLAYFKYANFFIDNFNSVLSVFGAGNINLAKIIMPIGISFFSFQKFTYGIDVYRGKHKPLDKVSDLALYILLFPQLIAGPIVRYGEIADSLRDRRADENAENRLTGLYRFIIGLSKKVLIANVMGAEADKIFAMQTVDLNSSIAWIGILAYTFQIYFDFSGYSDMAIGLGKMIGFKFPENFDNPYVSKSITEFWRRWHMTLGRWMRDYLYIPLGGSKVDTKFRLFFNLWFVFLISGLWHGAAWTFIAWGAFHGVFLILDRLFLLKILEKLGKFPAMAFTFLITMIGWVIFRAESLSQAVQYIKTLFSFNFGKTGFLDTQFISILVIAIMFSFLTAFNFGKNIENKVFFSKYSNLRYLIMALICLVLLIVCIANISASGFNPFIYFRF